MSRRLSVLAVALVAVLVSACGEDTDDASAGPTPSRSA